MSQVQIDPRFHGPPHSANGGYACGVVASLTDVPVAVSLRLPPPLATPMSAQVRDDGGVRVLDGEALVAEAVPSPPPVVSIPAAVAVDQARDAQHRYTGFHEHPFPTCWVCGPDRPGEDGLRIFPGAVEGPGAQAGLVASVWTPDRDVDDGHGRVATEHVWAALDCPSYFGAVRDEPALLARLHADLAAPVQVGAPHVVLGWATDRPAGRKRYGASAVLAPDGSVVASAAALWVTLSAAALAELLDPA